MQPQPQAVMAGIGDVVPVLFIIIALISGFLNFLKEKKNAAEAEDLRRRKRERKQNRPDDELSAFLEEVGATGATERPKPRRRKRSSQRDRAQQRRQQREKAQQEQDRPSKSSVADRHLETSPLGQVSSRHVESAVEHRHLQSQVADQHLYEQEDSAGIGNLSTETRVHPIAKLLSSPDGIRNAIIINEILQPPLSLRNRK